MTMKRPFLILGIYVGLSFFSLAGAVTMDQFTVTDKVDPQSMKPIGSKSDFPSTAPEIWVTAYLSNATPGTAVSVEWLFREESQGTIVTLAQKEIQADGTRYVNFRLAPNEGQSFPAGRYRALLKINNEEAGSINFRVSVSNNAVIGEDGAVQYMNYKDKLGRFTADLPGTWFPAEIADPNMAVLIALNTQDDPLAKIAISVYNADLKEGYTAKDAVMTMRNVLVQESKSANATLLADQIAQDTPEATIGVLYFTYTSPAGKTIEDRKMIFCAKNQIYLLTFINEKKISHDMKAISNHVIDSFRAL
jgi:hypothetical protein